MPNQFFIPLVLAFDLFVVATVVGLLVRIAWKPLERSFPVRQPSEPSYRRKFQTFCIGWVNFGSCIHVVMDDRYLHLTPIWLLGRVGMKPISIPWDAIDPLPASTFGRKTARVQIGIQKITGPKWCFELIMRRSQTKVPQ